MPSLGSWLKDNFTAHGGTSEKGDYNTDRLKQRIVGGVWGPAPSKVVRGGRVAVKGAAGFMDDAGRFIFQGVRKSPTQVGDDAARAFVVKQSPKASAAPAAGIAGTAQMRVPGAGYVVAAAGAGVGLAGATYAFKGASKPGQGPLETPLLDAGQGIQGALGGIGAGLAEGLAGVGAGLAGLFSGAGAGAGAGVGGAAYNALAGVGEGVKRAAIPLVLLGLGAIAFQAARKRFR